MGTRVRVKKSFSVPRAVGMSSVTADQLRATFPSQPSAIELHGACAGRTAMNARLALAVRLARRDLQRSLLVRGSARPQTQSMPEVCPPVVSNQPTPTPLTINAGSPPSKAGKIHCQMVAEPASDVELPAGESKAVPEAGGSGKGDREEYRESSDLVCLQMALAKQVQRLQELCAREYEREGGEEEEREKERTAQQVSVVARKLYDLQRQVSVVDGAVNKGEAIRRLAAARRAASRTLHSFSSSSSSLPGQLLELLGQLCEDRQSSHLLALAKTYSDVLRNAREPSVTPQTPKRKADKAKKAKTSQQRHKTRNHSSRAKCSTTPPKKQSKRKGKKEGRLDKKERQSFQTTTPPPPPPSQCDPLPPPQCDPRPTSLSPSPLPKPQLSQQPQSVPSSQQVVTGVGDSGLPQLSLPHLVSMTTTLNCMEEAEEMIFHRWGQATSSSQEVEASGSQREACLWLRGLHPQSRPAHSQQWRELERLADLLLEEVLAGECSQLLEACDCLASNIFCDEFYRAAV